jgi:diphosphomevalonate decarboxylase
MTEIFQIVEYPKLPERLRSLQLRLRDMRFEGRILLQNGDRGFATAPSNIALIKYWGKEEGREQIPVNSSLSLTLGAFRSFTEVVVRGRFFPEDERATAPSGRNEISLSGDGRSVPVDAKLERLVRAIFLDWADEVGLSIISRNNFPTACGLASSASGYAALVGAIADLLQLEKHFSPEDVSYWLAEWARIGSGSATRSTLRGPGCSFVAWEREDSSGEPWTRTFPIPVDPGLSRKIHHCVLVVDETPKEVSSSTGHLLAGSSPLQSIRVAGLAQKMERMKSAVARGDFATIATIAEDEAFALHAVMQSGKERVNYFRPATELLLSEFVRRRNRMGESALWTLDAGPNIHILYLSESTSFVQQFVNWARARLDNKLKVLGGRYAPGLALGLDNYREIQRRELVVEGLYE